MVAVSYKESGVSRTCWPGWGWGDDNHNALRATRARQQARTGILERAWQV